MKRCLAVILAGAVAACSSSEQSVGDTDPLADSGFEPPVLTNPDIPVRYPPGAFAQRLEGTVVLRLYVDATGALLTDSTRVAEGSGVPVLDSAAVAAVPAMQFAPALREGVPVGAAFLQPIHFRHPESGDAGGGV
jgi:TonB family protein